MDEAAEEEGLKRYREARSHEMFPDEVDTPLDAAARIRWAGAVRFLMRSHWKRPFLGLTWWRNLGGLIWSAVLHFQVPALQGPEKFPLLALGPHGELARWLFTHLPVPELWAHSPPHSDRGCSWRRGSHGKAKEQLSSSANSGSSHLLRPSFPLWFQDGWYVTVHVIDVPFSVMESVQSGKPLVLVSLLPHEQKVSPSVASILSTFTQSSLRFSGLSLTHYFSSVHRCQSCMCWCGDTPATPSQSNLKRNLCSTADFGDSVPPLYSPSTHQVEHLLMKQILIITPLFKP